MGDKKKKSKSKKAEKAENTENAEDAENAEKADKAEETPIDKGDDKEAEQEKEKTDDKKDKDKDKDKEKKKAKNSYVPLPMPIGLIPQGSFGNMGMPMGMYPGQVAMPGVMGMYPGQPGVAGVGPGVGTGAPGMAGIPGMLGMAGMAGMAGMPGMMGMAGMPGVAAGMPGMPYGMSGTAPYNGEQPFTPFGGPDGFTEAPVGGLPPDGTPPIYAGMAGTGIAGMMPGMGMYPPGMVPGMGVYGPGMVPGMGMMHPMGMYPQQMGVGYPYMYPGMMMGAPKEDKGTEDEEGGPSWYSVPAGFYIPEDTPAGLEVLAAIDGILVHQQVEFLESAAQAVGIGFEGNNRYRISNRLGVQIYQAVEDTGFCWRFCCGALRPAHIRVFDAVGHEVMSMQRKFRCCPCAWFKCCREEVEVFHGSRERGTLMGIVTQPCCGGCCIPALDIVNETGEKELGLRGEWCIGDCCGTSFQLEGSDGVKVGELKKLKANSIAEIAKETVSDADRFSLGFPLDLKVETKATTLMALFVIDYIFFENGGSASANMDGSCTIDLFTMYCCGCPIPCKFSCGGIDKRIPKPEEILGDNDSDKESGGAPVAEEIDR